MRDSTEFRSDEGPKSERLEISYEGNLDWYLTLHPTQDDESPFYNPQPPISFRVCTSGGQLPGSFTFIAALMFNLGKGERQRCIELGEALVDWLKREAHDAQD